MLPDAAKLMKRATRAAKSVHRGTDILEALKTPKARALLIEGAEEEVPSVAKIADLLFAEFKNHIKQTPVKTLIGLCVRAVLAEENYELVERGVRIPEGVSTERVFSTGAVYAKVDVDSDDHDSDDDELVRLLVAVGERLLSEKDRKRVVEELEATYS